jgi:uncharacterized RDD family membrane protein YckC
MHCSNCGTTTESASAFCPNCGTKLGSDAFRQASYSEAPFNAGAASSTAPGYYARPEEKGRRVVAYLIDIVPMLLLALIHLLPIFGWMLYGLVHACYWLFRDIGGASPGKLVVGSYVANENGGMASTSQRVMRNVPLAIPGILGMIPLLGIAFEFAAAAVIFGGEAIVLLATGRRMGDRLAGTNVFRK